MSVRVFSHTCSNTEIVCALGCADLLVGVDADSDYPPQIVGPLPKPGRDLDLDVAAVAALAPDLVLTSLTVPGHERIVGELRARGLEVIVIDPQSLDDVFASIRTIAAALGVPDRGERLASEMDGAMPRVEARHRPRILVEWWPKPAIVPARRSWVTDMIERAGGINPLRGEDAKSIEVRDPLAAAPDAIVMSWCGVREENYRAEVVRRRAGWEAVPAIRDDRIHAVTEAFLGRPGPRLVEGYRRLRDIIAAVPAA